MNKIEKLNDSVLKQVKFIDKDCVLSSPLLVSANAKGKILYIGQETNGWFSSSNNNNLSARDLEKKYDDFFMNSKMPNTLFWKFIKRVTDAYDVANFGNVTWTNLFVCGNKDRKGTPLLFHKIEKISVDYLANLVDILEIEKILAVVGPNDPYHIVLNVLSTSLGWNLSDSPKKDKPYVYSDNEKIFYTYHPMYLQISNNINKTIDAAKKFVKKG